MHGKDIEKDLRERKVIKVPTVHELEPTWSAPAPPSGRCWGKNGSPMTSTSRWPTRGTSP